MGWAHYLGALPKEGNRFVPSTLIGDVCSPTEDRTHSRDSPQVGWRNKRAWASFQCEDDDTLQYPLNRTTRPVNVVMEMLKGS